MADRADTVPGFTMQSENFYLKFVTGMQQGSSSKLLEYETDWYEVMEILLSRLEDEPASQAELQTVAGRDLEHWALAQPGGDTLNLKIQVQLEEKRYFMPPLGSRKTMKLTFNDRFTTQVIFHVKKKQLLRSLVSIASEAVAAQLAVEEAADWFGDTNELPVCLVAGVRAAWRDCWTARHHQSQLPACAPHCSCKVWRATTAGGPAPRLEGADKREAAAGGKAEAKKRRKVAKMPEDAKGKTIENGDKTGADEGNVIETRKSTARKTKVNTQRNSEETESKISPKEKQDTKYTKLQRKYETMQIKFKAMKKDHAMKNQLKNLQQKYKALQEEVKGLKKESVAKTATSPGEVENQPKPARRITRAAEAAALEASGAKPRKQEKLQAAPASRGRFAGLTTGTRTRAKAKPSPARVKPAGQELPVRRKRHQG